MDVFYRNHDLKMVHEAAALPAWKISGQTLFSGQANVAQKSWIIKTYIQYSEFKAHSVFQGKTKLLKNPECKKCIQYCEKFQGKICISGHAQVAQQSWTVKKASMQCIQCIFTWERSV